MEPNGWFERHVTESLTRIEAKVDLVSDKLEQHQIDNAAKIAHLEERTSAKASIFGAIAGALTGIASWFLRNG